MDDCDQCCRLCSSAVRPSICRFSYPPMKIIVMVSSEAEAFNCTLDDKEERRKDKLTYNTGKNGCLLEKLFHESSQRGRNESYLRVSKL